MHIQKKSMIQINDVDYNRLKKLSRQYNYNAPGYYSYPTIVDFNDIHSLEITSIEIISRSIEKSASLYIHIPFCQSLCYYCGCHKDITKDRGKADKYISNLIEEIYLYKDIMQPRYIESVHLGGGSPNFLTEFLLIKLINALHENFNLNKNTAFSIEVDPRTTTIAQIVLLSKCGFRRISFGVQDFHENVQKAINRIQDTQKIRELIDISKKYGFESINIDLVYGLPLQTVEMFHENVSLALDMEISRITITKYSHLPVFFPSQRKLDKYLFPDELERLIMFFNSKKYLQQHGYKLIGLDHFVKDTDPLFVAEKENRLLRNFIGYDVAYSSDILGLGTSAISNFNGCYFQNEKNKSEYYSAIENNVYPVKKTAITDQETKIIWSVIHRLLCYKRVDLCEILTGADYEVYFQHELQLLQQFQKDGLVRIIGSTISVTEDGDLFLRNICSVFDTRVTDQTYFKRFTSGI